MIKKAEILAILIVFLSLWSGTLRAGVITIYLTAEVTYVDDLGNLLEGTVTVGDTITGSYIYDSDTPDTNPIETVGDYRHYNAPFGINLSVGTLVFQTDPDNVDFLVEVCNNHIYSSWDGYLVKSASNLALSNGVYIDMIYWALQDSSGMALPDISLPKTPPALEDWDYNFGLSMTFGEKGSSSISAIVTSAVPEPATVLLFALGCLVLTRRRR